MMTGCTTLLRATLLRATLLRATLLPAALAALAAGCAGGRAAPAPVAPAPAATRVVGYLAAGGVRSKGTRIADLPAAQLTHVFYAFARIDADGRLALGDPCVDAGDCRAAVARATAARAVLAAPSDTLPNGAAGFDVRRLLADSAYRARVLADTAPVTPGGNFAELRRLKARYPHLGLLLSVGGWGGSARFSDVALTPESRRAFAASAVERVLRDWPGLFDGLDVDWEFPVAGGMAGNVERPEDRTNFTALLAELRRQLDAEGARDGRHYLLTIAASARAPEVANVELGRITPLLDWINVMTYDYHSGSAAAHFNAPLFAAADDPTPSLTVDASMRAFLAAGVPATRLLVGVPFYGRAYGGVPNVNAGLYQRAGGLPRGWRELDGDYRVLARTRLADPAYVRRWHPAAQVPWLYDSAGGTWVSYDDSASVARKADYVRAHGLGGVAIWELGGDDGTLLRALVDRLRRPRPAVLP